MATAGPGLDLASFDFIYPGDAATLTGGYGYDRRIIDGLRARGWTIVTHALAASFPQPDAAALEHAGQVLASIAGGRVVVIDGLAFGALAQIAARQARRLRLVALVHHPLALETGLDPVVAQRLHHSERAALAHARRVIVTSPTTAHLLSKYRVDPARIDVVPPGTDPAPLARGSASDRLSLLCVASLVPRKGHLTLVDALARLRERPWHLRFVGSVERDPAYADAVRRRIAAGGLADRIELCGEVDAATLGAHYDRADVFVLPSHLEGYGMALAEALARGLPILSTVAGAIPQTVPAEAGLLVQAGDSAALAGALLRLIDEPGLRHSLSFGARSARARLPDWPAACMQFERCLQAL